MNKLFRSNLYAMFGLLIWLIGNIILGVVLKNTNTVIARPQLSIISYLLFLFLPFIGYLVLNKDIQFKQVIRLKRLKFSTIIYIILFALLIQPFMMFLSSLSSIFVENKLSTVLQQSLNQPTFILIIAFAIAPAIFEELMMRGIILSGYKKVDIKIAALINGLLFSSLHLNLQQFLYTFFLGIFFVYLVEATGSILSSILAHFVINGSQLLLLLLTQNNINTNKALTLKASVQLKVIITAGSFVFALIITPFALLFLYLIITSNGKKELLNFKHLKPIANYNQYLWPVYVCVGIFISFCTLTLLA